MKKIIIITISIFSVFFSTGTLAETNIEQQFKVFQEAILHRDEIIKSLIKRIELLEGEVNTIKNDTKIKQIVEQSLQPTQSVKVPEKEANNSPTVPTPDKNDKSLADQAFERQLLDRGGLVLPLYTSVVNVGLTTINSATDNILIDGFTIFPVLVVGDIVSERIRRDTTQLSLGWRMGLPYDLQLEANIPYNYLSVSRVKADSEEESHYDSGLGDIELGLSYQLTNDHEWLPDSLLAARWKTTTGHDPYEYTDPENHSTGSGFDAISVSYTAVTVDDPLAYHGGLSYTYNISDEKNIGKIQLGDTIGFSVGTSLAINQRSSWSFGFSQSWTQKTKFNGQELSGTKLTTAMLNFGVNYIFDNELSLNTSLGIGLTEDSPDFQFGFNIPMRFGM
ncbi:MAG: transporter [Gammaproteobacteria bacterium]|nr:transporter [Gammaproteobacteria bacterium]